MIINRRNTKKMEKENKPKDVKVIKNFYIIIDEVDGKPIAKRVFKGEDGNDFEEEFTENMERFIKNKDQLLPGNKFEVAYQEEVEVVPVTLGHPQSSPVGRHMAANGQVAAP
jgi:hypothetical protein